MDGGRGKARNDLYLFLGLVDPLQAVQLSMPVIRIVFDLLDRTTGGFFVLKGKNV